MSKFNSPNIFMKFTFRKPSCEEESVMFLYSNSDGMEHLNSVLKNNPLFSNLLTPEEILVKMKCEISYSFGVNNYTGVEGTKWIGKHIVISSEDRELYEAHFPVWKNQLEKFIGAENLFTVIMPRRELSQFFEMNENASNEELFNFIECYRLNKSLNEELTVNNLNKRKSKL